MEELLTASGSVIGYHEPVAFLGPAKELALVSLDGLLHDM